MLSGFPLLLAIIEAWGDSLSPLRFFALISDKTCYRLPDIFHLTLH